jgi:imidazolonepropionase-like amidohydrolase
MRLRLWIAGILAVAGAAYFFLWAWPLRDPHPKTELTHGALAIRDVKIYATPDDSIEHANIVMRDGLVESAGPEVRIPADAQVLACEHCVVTAGFWNAHVHFTESKWSAAAWTPTATLNAQVADMLTSRGFSTVVDAGSDPRVSISLRRRIESGELAGPKIYTAGRALFPPNGIPYYTRQTLPFYLQWFLPQPGTPAEAAKDEERNIAEGADLLKLFTGSYVERGRVQPMPVEIAKAAVDVAHAHGQLAYSHPSNFEGTRVAMESGVDVLAHAPDSTNGITPEVIRGIVDKHMAMIPTLKMFATTVSTKPGYLQPIYGIVREFHKLGGELIFGTDVGYMTDYTTADEYRALAECGLSTRDVLRMLTVAPSVRFGVAGFKGTVVAGKVADVTVLDGDPETDVTAFSRPRYTIRNGRVIFSRP